MRLPPGIGPCRLKGEAAPGGMWPAQRLSGAGLRGGAGQREQRRDPAGFLRALKEKGGIARLCVWGSCRPVARHRGRRPPPWLGAGRDARGQGEPGCSRESAGSCGGGGGGFERATLSWHGEGPESRMGARQWHCGRRRRAQRDLPASSGLLRGWERGGIPLPSQQPGQGDAHPS